MAQLLDFALKFYALLAAAGNFDNKQQSQKRRIQSRDTHKTKQTTRQTVGHTFYEPTLNRGHLNRNKVVCVLTEIPLNSQLIRPTPHHPFHKTGCFCFYVNTFHKFIYATRCLFRDI